MNAETPSPKRKRRRWIIAGVFLLMVGVGCWRYWPRVDQRLVGTWQVRGYPTNRLRLRADGTGTVFYDGKPLDDSVRWCVTGSTFHFHARNSNRLSDLESIAHFYWARLTGADLSGRYFEDVIEHVDSSTLQLRLAEGYVSTYERVSD